MAKVYIVGAGPGDYDLITVKGLKAIQQADVILYDRLINQELLDEAPDHAELIFCGKRPDHHALTQSTINHLLCKYALQGKTVTRLKGGDPFVFGRGGEEAEELSRRQIAFEIVPGITSGIAAPAYAGIPVTHREYSSSVAFISGVSKLGIEEDAYWEHVAKSMDTLCIYMGVKKLPDICGKLVKHGRGLDTPVALVRWGTTEQQETVTGTLEDIVAKAADMKNPAMIVVGEVVKLREQLQWFESIQQEDQVDIAKSIVG
ncbi:uroporphyrinogen-III C-methyltransferase [Halobacillus sp. ACCC02827]|uniref:uroporphyrinogen-III C-methyltransferase n=1 Tax=Bacillaceae TaxID=186817 RepID=UPI0002A521E2|nr:MULTISPECIES: uroporphyrinogen-III C-methyltransferase [Bacillaceae]ELK46125.1 uroporphyrinogen-III C-methyltransferase [Halobacillus sp. BAB-2008]QHT46613.1 uroporphyrinogen-III C-methyltransferase [Bacillus sp. SB49]WJE17425.1 uroporphyrinogen-III C-methyltransferase [Halobacillus sp. ACCC02827]